MRNQYLLIGVLAGLLTGSAIHAATPPPASSPPHPIAAPATPPATAPAKSDIPPDLAKQAKVTLEAARVTALSRVKGGAVQSEELEREHGKLIYSFDVTVPGKSGVTEVNVDAKTGKVLNVHHESPAKEKQEAKTENKPPGA